MRLLAFCFVLMITFSLSAQEKYEREYRISDTEVPSAATAFVDALDFQKKVKWYLEESLVGETIEAKSRKNGRYYSIEFDKSGNLQDVEIKVAVNALPDDFRVNMFQYFDSAFDRVFKIGKIQEQFSGDTDAILRYLTEGTTSDKVIKKYEVVFNARKGEANEMFECTFAADGTFESQKTIILSDTDNLEF